MRPPKGITDNLRFLCVEIDGQRGYLQSFVAEPSAALARRIQECLDQQPDQSLNVRVGAHTGITSEQDGHPRGWPFLMVYNHSRL